MPGNREQAVPWLLAVAQCPAWGGKPRGGQSATPLSSPTHSRPPPCSGKDMFFEVLQEKMAQQAQQGGGAGAGSSAMGTGAASAAAPASGGNAQASHSQQSQRGAAGTVPQRRRGGGRGRGSGGMPVGRVVPVLSAATMHPLLPCMRSGTCLGPPAAPLWHQGSPQHGTARLGAQEAASHICIGVWGFGSRRGGRLGHLGPQHDA